MFTLEHDKHIPGNCRLPKSALMRLANERERQGINGPTLAARLGMTADRFRRLEAGQVTSTAATYERWAKALGLAVKLELTTKE